MSTGVKEKLSGFTHFVSLIILLILNNKGRGVDIVLAQVAKAPLRRYDVRRQSFGDHDLRHLNNLRFLQRSSG